MSQGHLVMRTANRSTVFVGGIRAGLGDLNAVPFQYANTSVLSTVLVKSAELAFLDKTSQSWGHVMHHTNTDNTSWSHASLFNQAGAWSETEIHSKAPLKDVIEELFQNITISLMSSPLLQYVIPPLLYEFKVMYFFTDQTKTHQHHHH